MLLGRGRLLADPKRLGRWGERQAGKFLKKNGLKIIARNYRARQVELDIVAADTSGAIVFVEVKTRRHEDFAPAHASVGHIKKQRMIRAAKLFLARYKIKDRPLRFDIVTVVLGQKGPAVIKHYRNSFVP